MSGRIDFSVYTKLDEMKKQKIGETGVPGPDYYAFFEDNRVKNDIETAKAVATLLQKVQLAWELQRFSQENLEELEEEKRNNSLAYQILEERRRSRNSSDGYVTSTINRLKELENKNSELHKLNHRIELLKENFKGDTVELAKIATIDTKLQPIRGGLETLEKELESDDAKIIELREKEAILKGLLEKLKERDKKVRGKERNFDLDQDLYDEKMEILGKLRDIVANEADKTNLVKTTLIGQTEKEREISG